MRALKRAGAALAARFDGGVSPRPYAIFRVGLALVVLVRTSDVLRPVLALDHHGWVRGLEHAPWSDPVAAPRLHAPLLSIFDVAGDASVATVLVVARVVAAFAVLVGVGGRAAPLVLGLAGWSLMAADRFRYLHHVHLLWLSCLLLALMPAGQRLAPFARSVRAAPAAPAAAVELVPRWPLVVARYHLLVAYAAAGIAKLTPEWLSGDDIARLADAGLVSRAFVTAIGAQPVALAAAVIELVLVPLLIWPRTRVVGVALGLAFHATTAATMMVSVFPALMALHLMLFLPWRESVALAPPSAGPPGSPDATRAVPGQARSMARVLAAFAVLALVLVVASCGQSPVEGDASTDAGIDAEALDAGFDAGTCVDEDGDGLSDGHERLAPAPDVDGDGTPNEQDLDSDGDGVSDHDESQVTSGYPCRWPGGCHDAALSSPWSADSDFDGTPDGAELAAGTAPCDADEDRDGCPDGELTCGTTLDAGVWRGCEPLAVTIAYDVPDDGLTRARVTVVLEPATILGVPFDVAPGTSSPSVASDATSFLVVPPGTRVEFTVTPRSWEPTMVGRGLSTSRLVDETGATLGERPLLIIAATYCEIVI